MTRVTEDNSDNIAPMTDNTLVLGGAGMLGSAVLTRLSQSRIKVSATARQPPVGAPLYSRFTVGDNSLGRIVEGLGDGDFVVNCIGMIKQRMDDTSPADRLAAIRVNSEFPYALAELAVAQGFRVIQIATDCVFSGAIGGYTEESLHDATDVYGKTKSLGEVPSSRFLNLRCSIIGQEIGRAKSLLGWLLSQGRNSTIRGFIDHRWNGVTTNVFADIVAGLIESNSAISGSIHLVPADSINKYELLKLILATFNRDDVTIAPTITGHPVDRTLRTNFPEQNDAIWRLGGFDTPPKIENMVRALGMP